MRNKFTILKISFIAIIFLGLSMPNLKAQTDSTYSSSTETNSTDTTSFKSKADRFNKKMEHLIKVFPVPIFSYSPETQILFGLSKFNDFNIGDTIENDSNKTQPSTITGLLYYTQKQQFKFNAETDLMFHQNKQNLKARITYLNFPLLFFGIGDYTNKEDAAPVLYEDVQIVGSFAWRIGKKSFIGPSYKYLNSLKVHYIDTTGPDRSPLVDSIDVTKNAGVSSGFGATFTYEGRDNRLNPYTGTYFNFELEFFEKWLGGNFGYTRMYIDIRKYVSILPKGKLVLAGQALGEFVTDGANIQGLPAVGGPDWGSRGIYFGRFRDQSSLAGNLEARFPLFWIFGGTIFGGMGQVQPNLAQFRWDAIHYVYGAGFRIEVSSKNRVNLRIDLGFSKDNVSFIVDFAEAF